MMKTRIYRLVGILVLVMSVFSSCEKKTDSEGVLANELTLSDSSVGLSEIGETYQLNAIVKPLEAENKTVKWTSSNSDIMSVSSSGLVTVKDVGSVTITARLISDSRVSASCEISFVSDKIVGKWVSKGTVGMSIQFNGLANPEEGRFTYDEFIAYCEDSIEKSETDEEAEDFKANISYAQQCKLVYGAGCSLDVMQQNRLKVNLGKEGLVCSDCSWKANDVNEYSIHFTEKWNTPRERNSILVLDEENNNVILNLSPEPELSHTWFIVFEREQ